MERRKKICVELIAVCIQNGMLNQAVNLVVAEVLRGDTCMYRVHY